MNTEIADKTVHGWAGWIYYDAECRFCVAGRKRWGGIFQRRGFVWLPLQTPGAAAQLGVTESELKEEMWVRCGDGRVLNGLNAWVELMRRVWWLQPPARLLALPGLRFAGQAVYCWVARHRYCLAGRCAADPAGQIALPDPGGTKQ